MHVKQIYTYPIKSLRGTSPSSLKATYVGFQHDRRFMLQRVSDGKNMLVANFTEMCLFTTELGPDVDNPTSVIVTYTKDHTFDKPDQKVADKKLEVPLAPAVDGLTEVTVDMHYSPTVGFDMGADFNQWFSERFGYEVKLLYVGENRRKCLGNMPPNVTGRQRDGLGDSNGNAGANSSNGWLGAITSTATSFISSIGGMNDENKENEYDGVDEGIGFADVAPYLIINTKSWENAQKRLPEGEHMDISKFRPNIIIEGAAEEFEEDYWGEVQIGKTTKIVLTQNCARCNSLNVDYNTGKVGEGEAGRILKKLQSDRRVDPGAKWSPIFGRYGFLAKVPEGKNAVEIHVGDEVEVVRRNKDRTRFEWPNLSTN